MYQAKSKALYIKGPARFCGAFFFARAGGGISECFVGSDNTDAPQCGRDVVTGGNLDWLQQHLVQQQHLRHTAHLSDFGITKRFQPPKLLHRQFAIVGGIQH